MLAGQARPDGLGAIVFHGMWKGLWVLSKEALAPIEGKESPPPRPVAVAVTHDPELVRMLANMVLATESEARYVY